MEQAADIVARVARLEGLLESRFGAARGGLARRVAKVGRRVPRSVRRDLNTVVQAAQIATHPKLGLRIDHARVRAAAERAEAHLKAIDVRQRRIGQVLGILGALVFNLLLVVVILLVLLHWRGFV